jgi:hypothetical protein
MSIQSTIARVESIRQAMADPAELAGARTGGTEAPAATGAAATTFASALEQARGGYQTSPTGLEGSTTSPVGMTAPGAGASPLAGVQGGGTGAGAGIVAAAESQIGQSEEPLGSNEGAAIAKYRSATAGAMPGAPWCAYFASWAARQAGAPIGSEGQGLGAVSEIWSWAQSTGRAIQNGPGVVPKPGDLIVFGGEHVGIVRGVLPNGDISTIEGNYENKVAANVRPAGEATGYVNMN